MPGRNRTGSGDGSGRTPESVGDRQRACDKEDCQKAAPAHFRGDLVRQISAAIVHLNQSKKQHPILICDEVHWLPHLALEQLPLRHGFGDAC